MMADMLRELHSEKSDKEETNGKDVPMGDAKAKEPMDAKSEMTKAEKKAKRMKAKKEAAKKANEKEDKKSSLRRTLERMLERK